MRRYWRTTNSSQVENKNEKGIQIRSFWTFDILTKFWQINVVYRLKSTSYQNYILPVISICEYNNNSYCNSKNVFEIMFVENMLTRV